MKKIIFVSVVCIGIMCTTAINAFGAPFVSQDVSPEEVGAAVNENYYSYVNFERIKNAVLPYDKDGIMAYEDWTADALKSMFADIIANKDSFAYGSNEQKIADCYAQLLDTEARNSADVSVITDMVEKIENVRNIDELAAVSAELHFDYGVPSILPFRVGSGPFDSSAYHISILPINMLAESDSFFTIYGTAENVQRTYRRIIESRGGENARARAKNATDLMVDIASDSLSAEQAFGHPENFVSISTDELKAMFTADISPYTDIFTQHGESTVAVYDPVGLRSAAERFTDDNIQAWKDHLTALVFQTYANQLPDEYFEMVRFVSNSVEVMNEQRAFEDTLALMSKEADCIFAAEYADISRISAARDFVGNIICAYKELIENSGDLDPETKAEFIKKLENCKVNIDVPHEPYNGGYDWIPAENGGGLLTNCIAKSRSAIAESLDMLGKPFDKSAYNFGGMPSFTFYNAGYDRSNYVTIPYATICEPFFSPDASLAVNLGRLGYIIGHEISHAFDSTCMLFDSDGNLAPDHISAEYAELLEKKKADITALYDSQKLFGIYPVNGAKTLSENMADIASMQCMLSMLDTKEEKQEFMETFAGSWFTYKYDSTAFEQITADTHSPEEFRVNTVLSQMDDFYEVYGITSGSMYTAPADRRRVW